MNWYANNTSVDLYSASILNQDLYNGAARIQVG